MGNANVTRQVENCLNSATIEAAQPAKVKGLDSADLHVQPRLVEVDYYGTGVKVTKYDPQNGVKPHFGVQDGKSISPEKVFVSRNGEIIRVVAVIGGAGYGKTEMLKKFANDVICKKVTGLEDISVVYFACFRDLPVDREVTPGEFLLGDKDLSPGQIRSYIGWIREHSSSAMLVLDGVDQYQEFNKLGKKSAFRNLERKASPVEIINAILSGNLIPGIRILFSAREHAIRHFESEVRPDRTVALIGLAQEDIEKLVLCYGGDTGQDIWCHLTTKAQCLLSVCSIPMFLNFTVLVFLESDKAPETLTEVLMLTLYNMVTSEHMRSRESIHNIIQQLKEMAFNGTNEERVIFTPQDLPDDLTIEELQDLIIPYPGRSGLNQKLVDGLFRFIFSHQSLQEALSSLHLNEMPIPEFEQFLERLHQPQWAIVRRFTCGIIVNKTLRSIVKDIDLQEDIKCEKSPAKKLNSPVTNIFCNTLIQRQSIAANEYVAPGAKSENVYHDSTFAADVTVAVNADPERQNLPVSECSSDKSSQLARQKSAILKKSLTKELERTAGHRDLLELLHSLHECGEDMESILPESMIEIVLGDVVPSQADAYVIAAIAKKCDQIRHVALNAINETQLFGLANVIKEQQLKVKFMDTTMLQQGKELVNLFEILLECGENFHKILPMSVTEIALGDFVPSRRDISIIAAIARKCDQIQHLVLNTINVAQLSGLVNTIREQQLKMRFKNANVPQQGKALVNLLLIFLEFENEIHNILPSSLREIILGDFVPSSEDVSVISAFLKMCALQIQRLVFDTFNVSQLNALANVVKKNFLEVKVLHGTIEIKNHDLLELCRAFRKCGDSVASVIRASGKAVFLWHVELDESNVDDLVFVLKFCAQLEYLSIRCPVVKIFKTVANAISMADLMIHNFEIDFIDKYDAYRRPLSVFSATICDMMPHVTDRLKLRAAVIHGERSFSSIQEKLDSLPKTELKIEIKFFEKSYELSWKKPYRHWR